MSKEPTGRELYYAVRPILDDLGIDESRAKSVTFHLTAMDADTTYSVEYYLSNEQCRKLDDRASVKGNDKP